MGFKLSDLEPNDKIIILASNEENDIAINASIIKIIKDNIAIINIDVMEISPNKGILNFDNVVLKIMYVPTEGIPYIWKIAQIAYIKSQYILQVQNDAVRNNRRDCYRVGVSKSAKLKIKGRGEQEVLVRDVSLSGFSITDRKKILNFKVGDEVSIHFDDIGHTLNLSGRLIRIEEQEEFNIYGFVIINLCKDLSSYIQVKQRKK